MELNNWSKISWLRTGLSDRVLLRHGLVSHLRFFFKNSSARLFLFSPPFLKAELRFLLANIKTNKQKTKKTWLHCDLYVLRVGVHGGKEEREGKRREERSTIHQTYFFIW